MGVKGRGELSLGNTWNPGDEEAVILGYFFLSQPWSGWVGGCGREENEPAARWKEQGVEGRGGGGCVDVGPVFCLVTAAGGCDPGA